ncbi:MAG: hypothetical protein HKO65_12215 [Gemmatimonadetes bacterium]|nr:hypothetical protein [Gemmatimonadota bacterium]NNM05845.1 hypothetical protein [Gemmatimonadota bacterium]
MALRTHIRNGNQGGRSILPTLFLAAAIFSPEAGLGQVRLGQPAAAFPEDFGAIQTVRELPDGRVLVADPLSKALYAVDLAAGTRQVIGGEGEGPEEYRQPDSVWPLPGDSTLLVDLGNGRLVVLGPDLAFGETMPIAVGDFQPGQPLVLAIPQGVDGSGNLYARVMGGGMGGGPLPDSADILRIDRATGTTEQAARFKIQDMTQTTSGGANNQNIAISPIPLSPEDAWGVARDGSVILARAGSYLLERIHPDGAASRGPEIPFDPIRIGTAEKEEYVAELGRAGGGIRVGVQMDGGQLSMNFARGGGGNREIDQYTWPEAKPPLYSGRIPVDPMGRAWVRRHVDAGGATTYDVFEESGTRIGTVLLETGKRVIGFGPSGIYVVAYDEFDLNYLERYDWPASFR